MLRVQLLELARANRPPPSYSIDQLIREHGHEVLRLPPYHPDFNAIELIWAQLKSLVRQRNLTFRLVCSQIFFNCFKSLNRYFSEYIC